MMRQLSIPAGAKMLIGAPAIPMPRKRSDALGKLMASIGGVVEAHLPQCFAIGVMNSPAQILVVAIDPATDQQSVLKSIDDGLSPIIPSGDCLDVWPVTPDNSMLNDIRPSGCLIFAKDARRPWWKFW